MDTKSKPTRLVEANGDELAALLSPIAPHTFVSEYFGRKPLFVKGFREKFKGFFDGPAFFRSLTAPGATPEGHLRASFDKKTNAPARSPAGEPVDMTRSFPIAPEMAGPLYEAGATICMTEIDKRVPRLAYFAAAVRRQLGYPGLVAFNAYLSGPGAGLNWHFDGRIATTLQIEGSKRWRFCKRAEIEWPRGNALVMSEGAVRYDTSPVRAPWEKISAPEKKDMTEVVLEPGDLLILPAGTWHDASGGGEGSLALNMAFNPAPYTYIVGELLDALLASDPGWRSAAPLIPRLGGAPGEVDSRALDALGKQLENAADALRSIAADSSALAALWSTLVQTGGPPIEPPPAPPSAAPVAQTDRFRVRADGNVYVQTAEKGTRLVVTVGTSKRFELTGEAMRFAQRALGARKFEASECASWGEGDSKLEWSDVEKHLSRLVDEWVIERVATSK